MAEFRVGQKVKVELTGEIKPQAEVGPSRPGETWVWIEDYGWLLLPEKWVTPIDDPATDPLWTVRGFGEKWRYLKVRYNRWQVIAAGYTSGLAEVRGDEELRYGNSFIVTHWDMPSEGQTDG